MFIILRGPLGFYMGFYIPSSQILNSCPIPSEVGPTAKLRVNSIHNWLSE